MEIGLILAAAALALAAVAVGGYAVAKMARGKRNKNRDTMALLRTEEYMERGQPVGMMHEVLPESESEPESEEEVYQPIQLPTLESPIRVAAAAPMTAVRKLPVEPSLKMDTEESRKLSRSLLKTKRENERETEEERTLASLQQHHPNLNVAETLRDPVNKELQAWLDTHERIPPGVRKYNIALDYPGELMGMMWRADSPKDPVQLYGMEPGKAGERNGIKPIGFLVSLAGIIINNADDMAKALKAVKHKRLTDFYLYTIDYNPRGFDLEEILLGRRRARQRDSPLGRGETKMLPAVEEIHADWVEEQESLAMSDSTVDYVPLSAKGYNKPVKPTGFGNTMNSIQLGNGLSRGPSFDYALHEHAVQQQINAIKSTRYTPTGSPFSRPAPAPTAPAHLQRHVSYNQIHVARPTDSRPLVAPGPLLPLPQVTRTAYSVGPHDLHVVGDLRYDV